MADGSVSLPPGLRFCPTDEELVVQFLYRKASSLPCNPDIIPHLHFYPCDPWELDGKAFWSGNQGYFFHQKMENQATENGFWKELEIEEPVFDGSGNKVGIKKYLLYHFGKSPAGIETNWIMQEYQLCNARFRGTSHRRNQQLGLHKWVVCRVYQKKESSCPSFSYCEEEGDDNGTELSCLDEMFLSLDDDLDDISSPN